LHCVPKNPNCSQCVFNSSCFALQHKRVNELPLKTKKTKVTNRYFNYLVFQDPSQATLLRKRTEKGIWHNLYEFPVIETKTEESIESVLDTIASEFASFNIESIAVYDEKIQHKLSHQLLSLRFFRVKTNKKISNGLPISTINMYPFPIVLIKFIEKHLN